MRIWLDQFEGVVRSPGQVAARMPVAGPLARCGGSSCSVCLLPRPRTLSRTLAPARGCQKTHAMLIVSYEGECHGTSDDGCWSCHGPRTDRSVAALGPR